MTRRRADARSLRSLHTFALYALAITARFRFTLLLLGALVLVGTVLFALTPHAALGGRRPPLWEALAASWMSILAQAIFSPPQTWYLAVVGAVYPLFGLVLIGEGVVRLGLLLASRQHGEKEWMTVMASTHRDHVVLCGLGHLGGRILQQLLARGEAVVAIERDGEARFASSARAEGVPVLIRDMKNDDALVEAGVAHARAIIIATNDDIANLEVALDARRLNPRIQVLMRMFDQELALKLKGALGIDEAFSSAALAAPMVVDLLDKRGKPG